MSESKPTPTDLASRVLDWLQGEGYPLEFRTAQIFREAGFNVGQGRHYRSEDSAPREIDVTADIIDEHAGTFLRVSYYVECKYSKGYPWVVLSSTNASMASSACIAQSLGNDLARSLLWCMAGDSDLRDTQIFSAPRRAGFGGRQAFVKSKDQFYSAMQGIVDAAQAQVKDAPSQIERVEQELEYGEVGFPLIVVDGELFEAFWDDEKEAMQVEERKHIRLHWQGAAAWRLRASVDIVTVDGLEEFLSERRGDIDLLLEKMLSKLAEVRDCIKAGSLSNLHVGNGARGFTGLPPFLRRLKAELERDEQEPGSQA